MGPKVAGSCLELGVSKAWMELSMVSVLCRFTTNACANDIIMQDQMHKRYTD